MKQIKTLVFLLVLLAGNALPLFSQILVEAESFEHKGGWVVDQQFMDEMGSPYLLAHGLGVKVENAVTTVSLKKAGKFRVWVRTKDWVAPFKASGAPGKFNLVIDGILLPEVFGTKYADWTWQDGGIVEIKNASFRLELQDLTGFEGRCDAILFCDKLDFQPTNDLKELTLFRRKLLGTTKTRNSGYYDLVVVGGGIPGITSSLMAARKGLKVALIQDRPVVGGNNSSETRVWLNGAINVKPYLKLGNIVKELEQEKRGHYGDENKGELYEDSHKLALLANEKNIDLYLNCRANDVMVKKNKISAVVAENILTGERNLVSGAFFVDCTGDGVIGYLAGADYEMSDSIMGKCNLWNISLTENETTFPKCPWALDLTNKAFPGRDSIPGSYGIKGEKALGGWYWESGFYRDPFKYNEWVRDWNFRAMYGAWDALKNVDHAYPKYKLNWCAYISGKRESRRLLGDLVLNDQHLLNSIVFDDGLMATGWDMDVHIPHKDFQSYYPEDPFISYDLHTKYKIPFLLPYRILYSRNINNLFMAGRDVSVTHQALGSVRVMRTGGLMGEVVGIAAYLCKKHKALPRDIYTTYLSDLKDEIVNKLP
jgi:hypothetical protein